MKRYDDDGVEIVDGPVDFRVSLINGAHLTETIDGSFREVLALIASDKWRIPVEKVRAAYAKGGKDAAVEPKKKLPGVLFSGTFAKRAASALIQHSGLICADLDELGSQLEATFEHIASDPHTLACFRSPTGTGLKVIFRCDPSRPHAESFRACEQFVLEHHGLEIDQACKDVSRICFVSHDPELFIAADAEMLPYPPAAVEFTPSGLNPSSGLELTPGDDYDQRGDFSTLLTSHGWSKCPGGWTRPGKTAGVSATFDKVPGRFYVFSSSVTGLEPQHVYRPWHVYAIFEHRGDFAAAAKALGAAGFGHQRPKPERKYNEHTPSLPTPAPSPGAPPTDLPSRSIFDFPLVADGDRSILLGNRYLNRGDGAVIVSTSGVGKSVVAIQGAVELALQKGPFGIQGNGPLSSLIIQSEDSDGDVAEVAYSLRHVLKLTSEQIATVNAKVHVVTDRVNRGLRFIAALRKLIEQHKPDLVWINPLQAFMDGDVTDGKDLGSFLREGLNSLNQPAAFGYVIIHHTTKPATGKDRGERLWHEVMYDMAGGAEIINWARAIISLRAAPVEGEFNMVLAKRGRRAGVTRAVPCGTGTVLEPVTTIPLKHATGRVGVPGIARGLPLVYWEPREPDAATEPTKGTKTGRPERHAFQNYRGVFPKKASPGATFNEVYRLCCTNGHIPQGSFHGVLDRWAEQGDIEIILSEHGPNKYRANL